MNEHDMHQSSAYENPSPLHTISTPPADEIRSPIAWKRIIGFALLIIALSVSMAFTYLLHAIFKPVLNAWPHANGRPVALELLTITPYRTTLRMGCWGAPDERYYDRIEDYRRSNSPELYDSLLNSPAIKRLWALTEVEVYTSYLLSGKAVIYVDEKNGNPYWISLDRLIH